MKLKTCQCLLVQAFDPAASPEHLHTTSQLLNPSATLRAEEQLLIYRHSLTGAQQAVVEMVYPVCRQILGEDCFNTLTRDYVWRFDSNCADLNQYGEYFADMLEQQQKSHAALNELPYIPDLARLEWAWHQSLFMADSTTPDPASLQNLISQHGHQLVPQTAPSVCLLSSPWPVYDVWQAHRLGKVTRQFIQPEQTEYYVIALQDSATLDKVSAVIYRFLLLAQQGHHLSAIAEKLGSQADQAFEQLAHMFEKGWLCGFQPHSQEY